MKNSKPKQLDQIGQSTLEFALTIILAIAFVLFFFQLTMIFRFGSYVHYATFMAARAYLSAGTDNEDQKTRAMNVMVRMVKKSEGVTGIDKFPSIAKGFGGSDAPGIEIGPGSDFQEGTRTSSWMQGVRYTFKSRLFLIPLAGSAKGSGNTRDANVNSLTLTSESWLGKEPSEIDCKAAMNATGGAFDNGC